MQDVSQRHPEISISSKNILPIVGKTQKNTHTKQEYSKIFGIIKDKGC